ncbi:hypothetical protein [Thermosediminibacter litoriperuensis]|uniref:Uncharacterized protein n=1 Tax=Thermosediminibacter litoriperuensis TaxID=291989 RepID=A0A5S5APD1_9FIRM|nr:hypothetical protein [Thermosediminibacter litoriperuensis]TYP53331.1 hypothetical protein LZ11_01574 [Thermosediminibacter litoriperuensis]
MTGGFFDDRKGFFDDRRAFLVFLILILLLLGDFRDKDFHDKC